MMEMKLKLLNIILEIFIFCGFFSWNRAEHLLLAGDSIDRFVTVDWCAQHNLRYYGWGDGSIRYRNRRNGNIIPALRCDNNLGDSISFVHIFGVSAHGPYLMGVKSYVDDPFIDTEARIPKLLELYEKEFHYLPDRMIFHCGQWDVPENYRYRNFSTRDHQYFEPAWEAYRGNLTKHINHILGIFRAKNATVNFGLRTAVTEVGGGIYLRTFNAIIRDLARSLQLTLYDMDYDAWSLKNFDYSRQHELFRDSVHPIEYVTGPAGNKLLGKRYSSFYKSMGKTYNAEYLHPRTLGSAKSQCSVTNFSASSYQSSNLSLAPLLGQCQDYLVFLVRKYKGKDRFNVTHFHRNFYNFHRNHASYTNEEYMKDVYFTTFINGTRYLWSNVTSIFMDFNRLSIADVLHVSEDDIAGFEVIGNLPEISFYMNQSQPKTPLSRTKPIPSDNNDIACVTTTSNRVFVKFPMGITYYEVNSTEQCPPGSRKVLNIDEIFLKFRPDDESHGPFENHILLEANGDRQVYYIDNGYKRPVWSIDVFYKRGWDISQVKIIDANTLDLFPMGEILKE